MSATAVDGFYVTTGWGTWGFKAIPAGGEGDGRADRHRPAARAHRARSALERFRRDHVLADAGSAGTR